MNVDAKLASKSLALRVRKVLTSLIEADQTAYVKDRYIGESVRLINDMLEYADKNNIEAILFSADFEKAFDSIDHTLILAVLKSYGFGPDFIQWVKTLLNNAESCVMNTCIIKRTACLKLKVFVKNMFAFFIEITSRTPCDEIMTSK